MPRKGGCVLPNVLAEITASIWPPPSLSCPSTRPAPAACTQRTHTIVRFATILTTTSYRTALRYFPLEFAGNCAGLDASGAILVRLPRGQTKHRCVVAVVGKQEGVKRATLILNPSTKNSAIAPSTRTFIPASDEQCG